MLSSLREQIQHVARRYKLRDIYVFGSRASEIAARVRGEQPPMTSAADVDIGVQPARGYRFSIEERVQLAQELERLFGASSVDLIDLGRAKPFLALDVIRGELLYSEDPDQQAEDELYVLRRAGDLFHFQQERVQELLKPGNA